ncbi:unnamed protein product, partial [Prorocentrum cordatum]
PLLRWRPPERSQNRELTHRFPPAARSQLGGRPSSSCIELGMAGITGFFGSPRPQTLTPARPHESNTAKGPRWV